MSSATADVTVNDASAQQTWKASAARSNEAGWIYMASLSASDRAMVMQLLFGVDGAHFAFGRIPIGASDYSFVDASKNKQAGRLHAERDGGRQRDEELQPGAGQEKPDPVRAGRAGYSPGLAPVGSPWTPPTWMKSPVKFDGGHHEER